MRARDAKRLHNRDQVSVRTGPKAWVRGYVVGDPYTALDDARVVFVNVQTESDGYLVGVRHTEIK